LLAENRRNADVPGVIGLGEFVRELMLILFVKPDELRIL
jgi:hypothetical protein